MIVKLIFMKQLTDGVMSETISALLLIYCHNDRCLLSVMVIVVVWDFYPCLIKY